jgi:phage tail-like protein
MDESGEPAMAWSWRRGLPLKWTGATMNAQQNQVAIEQLEIAHEGLTLVTGSPGSSAAGAAAALGSLS